MNKKLVITAIVSGTCGFFAMFVISQLHHFELGFHDTDHSHEMGEGVSHESGAHAENDIVPEIGVVTSEQEFLAEVIEELEVVDRQSAQLIRAIPTGDTTELISDLMSINQSYLDVVTQLHADQYGDLPSGAADTNSSDFRSIAPEWSESEKERVYLEDMILFLEDLSQTLMSLEESTERQELKDKSSAAIAALGEKQVEIQQRLNQIP